MTILYRIYQWLIAAPILLILTAITAPDHDYRDSLWETQFLGILACSFLVKMRLLFMVGESKGGWP